MPEEMQKLELHTILSNRTKTGMVNLILDDKPIAQWDVAKAKTIHAMLGEAIEAAISDELIYKFFTEKVGFDDQKASAILLDFRELRQGTFETVFKQ